MGIQGTTRSQYIGHSFAHKMILNINVLASVMLNVIDGHIEKTYVVTINFGWYRQSNNRITQKLVYPNGFCNCISHNWYVASIEDLKIVGCFLRCR